VEHIFRSNNELTNLIHRPKWLVDIDNFKPYY